MNNAMIRTKPKPSSKSKSLSLELEELKKAALTLRALNHKVRQQILNLIHERGEITVSEIYAKLKLEQSLTSSYLAVLRRANIVKTRREGQSIHYSVNSDHSSMVEKGAKMINGNS
jgi:DNA-binding transcriptional ArsR family regulator